MAGNSPPVGDFQEIMEAYNGRTGIFKNISNDYRRDSKLLEELDDAGIHTMFRKWKGYNKEDIGKSELKILKDMMPVFMAVVDSDIGPDWDDDDNIANRYEYFARSFLYDLLHVHYFYSAIYYGEIKASFDVDQDVAESWSYLADPDDRDWIDQMHSCMMWSWGDGGWIKCSPEGE